MTQSYCYICQQQFPSVRELSEHLDWHDSQKMLNDTKYRTDNDSINQVIENVMPEGQGKRTISRPRHDLIPVEFLDELASIFEEGLEKGYGDSWKKGGTDFLIDCLNHASNHLH